MSDSYDLAILGGGPGGYVAAIRAAQLGQRVCLVERDVPGGVCLNWGCIPSKSLIHQASLFRRIKDLEAIGVRVDAGRVDYAKVQAKSREAAGTLAKGVTALLRKNKVDVIKATGRLAGPGRLSLCDADGKSTDVPARNVIIATGSRPMEVPGFTLDEQRVMSSSGLLAMTELPASLIILGAGAIGCEFAYVMNAFGVAVTLVEMADQVLPSQDREVAQLLEKDLRASGVVVHTGTRAKGWRSEGGQALVAIEANGATSEVRSDKILAAFGRVPNTEDIGLHESGVQLDDRGRVITGDYGQTNIPGIFAIGDVTRSPALAHVASKEGEIVAEYLAGHSTPKAVDADLVPFVVYCEPQVAGFGKTEDQLALRGIAFSKSVFPFRAVGKSVATGQTEGFVKVLADQETGEVLGAHMIGHEVTELIHLPLLAKGSELVAEDIGTLMHAHPTLSEAVMEAARGTYGLPVHL